MPLEEPLFSELIQRLDGERGMRRKVGLLAGSWTLLRELSPQQRETLGLAIGNKWAWRNIESLFGRTGELSDSQRQVKEFFDSMRETEPEELRRMGKEIRQGSFATAAQHVLGAVEEALDEGEREQEDTGESMEVVSEIELEAPSASSMKPGPNASVEPSPVEQTGDLEEPDEPSEPIVASSDREDREPKYEPASEPGVAPEGAPEPSPTEATPAVVPMLTTEEVWSASREADGRSLSAVESLAALRRIARGHEGSTRAGRTALVESLDSAWAARRAVSALIRSHSAVDLEEAMALIEQLPGTRDRIWCLGDLVQYWDLDEEQRRRVLAAVPTDPARRRLSRRAERTL